MKIFRMKSAHPKNEYAPSWNFPFGLELWEDSTKIDSIRNWLIYNESRFLSLSYHHDASTGLGQDSVTSRFGRYNLFNFVNELKELNDLLKFLQVSYLNFVSQDNSEIRSLEIICWFNLLKNKEEIKEHDHGLGNDVYLSGNIHLENYQTYTNYRCPFDKNVVASFENTKGGLTIFPSFIPHYTTEFLGHGLRASIAFDLRLEGIPSNKNFHAIPFMNEKIFNQLTEN